jgi:hypothetical protein
MAFYKIVLLQNKNTFNLKSMDFKDKREPIFIYQPIFHRFHLMLIFFLLATCGLLICAENTGQYDSPEMKEKNGFTSIYEGDGGIFLADITIGKIIYIKNDGLVLNTKVPFGSLIKPFTLYYGLSSGAVNLTTIYYCRRSKITDPPHSRCWYTPGHGRLNSIQAITQSCNSAFMKMATKIDYEGFIDFLETLGFDIASISNIKNPLERQSIMTGLSDSLSESPACLALRFAALAEGTLFHADANFNLEIEKFITLDRTALQNVLQGMKMSMMEGHSKPKNDELFLSTQIIAKTGTIGLYKRLDDGCRNKKNNGFFIALFSHDQRKYLLAVVVPCGIGDDAAKIGREIIFRFLSSSRIQ